MRRVAATAAAALTGCAPELDTRLALVDEPRLIAVIAEPAEAAPGEAVTYALVGAAPGGALDVAPARWAYCLAPKAPTEDNAVASACLGDDDEQIVPLGAGATVAATVPDDACSRFGPDTPPGGFRPRDPDGTGGYYQPARATLATEAADLVAFGLHRLRCNLDGAPPEIARQFRDTYVANVNPPPPTLTARADGAAIDLTAPLPAGVALDLVASWPAAAAEPYVWYDPAARALSPRREAMRVAWFTDAGELEVDVSGVAEADAGATSSAANRWRPPDSSGTAHLWLVLRDSRGGVAVTALALALE